MQLTSTAWLLLSLLMLPGLAHCQDREHKIADLVVLDLPTDLFEAGLQWQNKMRTTVQSSHEMPLAEIDKGAPVWETEKFSAFGLCWDHRQIVFVNFKKQRVMAVVYFEQYNAPEVEDFLRMVQLEKHDLVGVKEVLREDGMINLPRLGELFPRWTKKTSHTGTE